MQEKSSKLIHQIFDLSQLFEIKRDYDQELTDDEKEFYNDLEYVEELLSSSPYIYGFKDNHKIVPEMSDDPVYCFPLTQQDFYPVNPKIPAFMIAFNPMSDKSRGDYYINHTRQPQMLLKVVDISDYTDAEINKIVNEFSRNASITEVNGEKYIIYPVQVYDKTSRYSASQIAKFMSRAADWFHSYIKFEDRFVE